MKRFVWPSAGFYSSQRRPGFGLVPGLLLSICLVVGLLTLGVATPPAQAADDGHISGTVLNASDVGIAGISVSAYYYFLIDPEWDPDWGWWELVGSVSTAGDGSYDIGGLATDTYRLQFHDNSGTYVGEYYDDKQTLDSATDIAVTVGETTSDIDATLADAARITGTVKNAADVGLANIRVYAYDSDADYDWDYLTYAYTGSDGSYDIGGLDAGSYRLQFYDNSGTYMLEYYDDKSTLGSATDIAVTAGSTTAGIDATLTAYGHITGTVKNVADVGLANVEVDVYRSNGSGGWDYFGSTYTNADGTYDRGGLTTNTYRLLFYDDSGTYLTEYYDDKSTLEAATDIAVTAGSTTSGIDATLATSGHITGTVTNASDVGLANVEVGVYRSNGSGGWNYFGSTYTNADGTYDRGGLDTGTYRVGFHDNAGTYLSEYYDDKSTLEAATDIAVTVSSTTSGIDATLATSGHITGTVKNAGDVGLATICVYAYDSDAAGSGSYFTYVYTNADGSYDIGGLDTGTYRLRFYDNSGTYMPEYYDNKLTFGSATSVAVTAGSTTVGIDATLTAYSHITGTVTNASDGGLANICVYAYDSDAAGSGSYFAYVHTNSDGSYDIGGLKTDAYRLRFYDSSGTYQSEYYDNKLTFGSATSVAVTAGSTTAGIDTTLAGAGHITGTVKNAGGDGLVGIEITVYHSDADGWNSFAYVNTNADGSYDIGGLDTDTYRLRFYDNYSGTYMSEYYDNKQTLGSATDVAVTAGSTTAGIDATLTAYGRISGTVKNSSGVGLSSIYVEVYRSGADGWDYWNYANTSADGSYDVGRLPAGIYRLAFYNNYGTYVSEFYDNKRTLGSATDIDVTAGETTTGVNAVLTHVAEIATLGSSSHPDDDAWYPDNTADLAWTAVVPTGVDGYSWSVDAVSDTTPDDVSEGSAKTTTTTSLADGIWYFHVRGHSASGGWGPAAHYTLHVDGGAPSTTDNADALPHLSFLLVFSPTDATSGVATTEYRIDGGVWRTGTSVTLRHKIKHKRPGYSWGDHLIEYRSTDYAGNVEEIKSCTVTLGS